MKTVEDAVAAHYRPSDLTNRILDHLGLSNAGPGTVPIEALFPADQLHHGGVGLTKTMAAHAGIQDGMRVLDAGSGIGGAARFLAQRYACDVQSIDLSPEFVETASDLDALVDVAGTITHRVGSVTDLPFEDGSFDAVWCQNVSMNVPDKAAMFAEAFRVLRPGGVYVLSHMGESGSGKIEYPLPWAMTAATSFATSPSDFFQALSDAGFSDMTDHAKDAPPPPPSGKPPIASPAMGERMEERGKNVAAGVMDGRIVTMLVTARTS